MKVADEAKTNDNTGPMSNEGTYSTEELDDMLEDFVKAKQIEADPKKLAMLKNYAISRNKAISDLFDINRMAPPPKSLKDLKATYDKKVAPTAPTADDTQVE